MGEDLPTTLWLVFQKYIIYTNLTIFLVFQKLSNKHQLQIEHLFNKISPDRVYEQEKGKLSFWGCILQLLSAKGCIFGMNKINHPWMNGVERCKPFGHKSEVIYNGEGKLNSHIY